MSEYDRNILGLGGTTIKKSSSLLRNEDDINFLGETVERNEVFTS